MHKIKCGEEDETSLPSCSGFCSNPTSPTPDSVARWSCLDIHVSCFSCHRTLDRQHHHLADLTHHCYFILCQWFTLFHVRPLQVQQTKVAVYYTFSLPENHILFLWSHCTFIGKISNCSTSILLKHTSHMLMTRLPADIMNTLSDISLR